MGLSQALSQRPSYVLSLLHIFIILYPLMCHAGPQVLTKNAAPRERLSRTINCAVIFRNRRLVNSYEDADPIREAAERPGLCSAWHCTR